jgi:DNA-binding transcriptional regulator GbsR (MarR family)
LLLQRLRVQFTMSLRKLREEKMTINSHARGSKESYSEVKDFKVNGIKTRKSDEEFEKEMVEMKAQLNVLKELLQKEEDQKCGWVMKKVVRWPIKQLVARRQRHMLKVWLKEA